MAFGTCHLGVALDSNTKMDLDTLRMKVCEPSLSDEFPVGNEALDAVRAENSHKTIYEVNAVLRSGISPLVIEEGPEKRDGCGIPDNTQHEDIYGLFSKFPVSSVEGENEWGSRFGDHAGEQRRNSVEIDREASKKALEALVVGCGFRLPGKNIGQSSQNNRSCDNQSENGACEKREPSTMPSEVALEKILELRVAGHG